MARRPYVRFEEVKAKIRMADILKVLSLGEECEKAGDGLMGVCPLPSHVHGPMPNPDQFKIGHKDGVDVWHCFGDCQRGGDVIEFVKAMTGYDNAHVRLWFAEHFGDRLNLARPKSQRVTLEPLPAQAEVTPPPAAVPAAVSPATPPPEPLKPLKFFLRLDPNAAYLQDRGIYPETVERFGLGQCSKGSLAGYIAIPIRDYPAGNLVAYLGRWAGEDYVEEAGRPRYKWPKDFSAHRVVYGLHQALESTEGQPLIVVEGPFKVFHLVQNGFLNTVSSFTASLSEEQAAILASTGRPIVLLFDGNEAGYKGMRAAAGKLISRTFVRVVKLPEGKEPDDLYHNDLAGLLR